MQLVIPMTGRGSRFQQAGYELPKPLIPIRGRSILQRLLESFPNEWKKIFIINEEHKKFEPLFRQTAPNARFIWKAHEPQGPGTALRHVIAELQPSEPVLVSYCDYGQSWDPRRFEMFVRESQCDAALISYRGFHAHYLTPQTYAYSRLENGRVVEVKEKGSFTPDRENEFASTGGYYFRSASLLEKALDLQFEKKLFMNGESYTSLTIQALLAHQPSTDVRVFEIDHFFQWGTPADLEDYTYWENTFLEQLRTVAPLTEDHVLMPMAGLGSRFQKHFQTPKPFLQIGGVPIYQKALQSLPLSTRTHFVAKEEHRPFLSSNSVTWLNETPPGQALTTLEGLRNLDPKAAVIISACDHAIVASPEKWNLLKSSDCEAAVMTVRGFPGARRSPKSFAYVQSEGHATLPRVQKVSVKVPLSKTPEKDPLLVGTFWFRSVGQLIKDIIELQKQNRQVNGELYLDSVLALLLEQNRKVLEFPLDGYINWGDPESLLEATYWEGYFGGTELQKKVRFKGVTEDLSRA